MKIAVVSGGFDPLHSGHLRLLKDASEMGDQLVILLNSDEWLKRKKGSRFMPFKEREAILRAIEYVDDVRMFDDKDGSAIAGLNYLLKYKKDDTIIFCNGGDRLGDNIPEMGVKGINFVFGVGGYNKINSSSKILQIVKRKWGTYRVLFEDEKTKVKELVIFPQKGISYQKHFKRSEIWFISKGKCQVKHAKTDKYRYTLRTLKEDDVFTVRAEEWHQINNLQDHPCHIIEIQYGEQMSELDIERDEDGFNGITANDIGC